MEGIWCAVAASRELPDDEDDDLPDLTPEMEESLDALEQRRKRRSGRPARYKWHSPVGVFEIALTIGKGGMDWVLMIEGEPLRHFEDHVGAMLAVLKRKSGHAPWDDYKGPVRTPTDEREWTAY